ncbi:lopap-like [Ostrinia nubilalis]|uniref:lopap-like n=1 Tax=Ostrinia nubilalis TaxID=29057 RepID=UPI0030823818
MQAKQPKTYPAVIDNTVITIEISTIKRPSIRSGKPVRMFKFLFCYVLLTVLKCGQAQVLQFGTCPEVKPVEYFALEKFLGTWYVIERFPAWFENDGHCAYKRIQVCGRRIEIEHVYVRDDIQYVLHVNSTYNPGDQAVFRIEKNNIDPVGIPISVVATDYTNYAILYGCQVNKLMNIKYTLAWILSRQASLPAAIMEAARTTLNDIPYTSPGYLEKVYHDPYQCASQWTAHVHAVNLTDTDDY